VCFAGWCVYRASEAKQRADTLYAVILRARFRRDAEAERARMFADYSRYLRRFDLAELIDE